ncbi:hypothetical protein LUZ60_008630 [Juncus effusus]|nr:hypothetical protein LUZ60_008630 [Juncus effusus]
MEALYLSSSFHLPASNSLILILLPSCNYSFVGKLSGSVLLLILLQRKRERMPYFEVKANQEEREKSEDQSKGIQIFYRTYGHGRTKVLLIIGFAGTHESWSPQIKGLTSIQNLSDYDDDSIRDHEEEDEGIEVCCFDNRGMGRSSIPANKSQYTTTIMARDALSLMDHLGWKKAHVFGHSMGGMIAFRLAAIAPERVSSLALLNVSGGGYQCFPRVNRHVISLGFKFLRAKTPEERAIIDLEVHYTKVDCINSSFALKVHLIKF